MTEAEWLGCADPTPMLKFLKGRVSDRKLRLFACACCRRLWHWLVHPFSRNAVEVAERFADGLASDDELYRSHGETDDIRCLLGDVGTETLEEDAEEEYGRLIEAAGITPDVAAPAAEEAWRSTTLEMKKTTSTGASAVEAMQNYSSADGRPDLAAGTAERAAQAVLLRDIIGHPFRRVSVDPSWLNPHVVKVAQRIYQERAFERLPELAEILKAAGCDHLDILAHCHEPGEHGRGCWVVDLILGKE